MAITITRSQFKIAKNQVFFYRLLYFLRENISLCESGGIRRPSARKKWTEKGGGGGKGKQERERRSHASFYFFRAGSWGFEFLLLFCRIWEMYVREKEKPNFRCFFFSIVLAVFFVGILGTYALHVHILI